MTFPDISRPSEKRELFTLPHGGLDVRLNLCSTNIPFTLLAGIGSVPLKIVVAAIRRTEEDNTYVAVPD